MKKPPKSILTLRRLPFRCLLDKSDHGFLQQDVLVIRLLAGNKSPDILFWAWERIGSLKRESLAIRLKRFRIEEPVQMDLSHQVRPVVYLCEMIISVKELLKSATM
jgi:hypothetical protein